MGKSPIKTIRQDVRTFMYGEYAVFYSEEPMIKENGQNLFALVVRKALGTSEYAYYTGKNLDRLILSVIKDIDAGLIKIGAK